MKKFSKILSVALLVALVLSLGVANAFAAEDGKVTISVARDASYDSEASGNREFTYVKVFDATFADDHEASNTQQDKTIVDDPNNVAVSYTLGVNDPWVTVLGTVDADTGAWTASQNWFTLTLSADKQTYIVSATDNMKTADNAKAAAEWLITRVPTNAVKGDLNINQAGTAWSAEVYPGYYLIKSSEGQNLVAASTSIDIVEKNTYPTIDKEQKDEDTSSYAADTLDVAVGDEVEYQVTVKVPADTNKDIIVTDTMSDGLTFNRATGTLTVTGFTEGADKDYTVIKSSYKVTVDGVETEMYVADADWQIAIHPTTATKGHDVVITFKAVVNAKALVEDVTQKNTVELKYNNNHYVMTDDVDFDIWASGIVKYDGNTAKEVNGALQQLGTAKIDYLEGVTFKLQESKDNGTTWTDVEVTKVGAYYRPLDPTATTAEVASTITTDANGQVIFRGLDGDKKYQLVELSTVNGFNLMDGPAALTLTKEAKDATAASIDEGTDEHTTYLVANSVTKVPNYKGTVLPSTGGIGTTIFYVVGGVLVLAAIILLVTKKRMSE